MERDAVMVSIPTVACVKPAIPVTTVKQKSPIVNGMMILVSMDHVRVMVSIPTVACVKPAILVTTVKQI